MMLLTGVLALACAVPVTADEPTLVRPQRLVHHFDFEERHIHQEELPMHWYIIGRPAHTAAPNFDQHPLHEHLTGLRGYPRFSQVQLDTTHALSDAYSLLMELDGGNVGTFLEVGTIPVMPGSDYSIVAHVRTQALERAGAFVTAYFIDDHGQRIDASIARTAPIRSNEQWSRVSVDLPGEHSDAAWIGLELALLQPQPSSGGALGRQELVLRDVRGRAWFDEIQVWQVPHLEVATQSALNLVRSPEQPTVRAEVRDFTGQAMHGLIRVFDHERRQVDAWSGPVGDGAATRWTWTPDLPRYGWYMMQLEIWDRHDVPEGEMRGQGEPVARTLGAMQWRGPREPIEHDRERLTLLATGADAFELEQVAELAQITGLGSVGLSLWDKRTTLDTLEQRIDHIENTVNRLRSQRIHTTMSLWPLPEQLLDQHADADALQVVYERPETLASYLRPGLMRLGQQVSTWHLGGAEDAEAFQHREREAALHDLNRSLTQMVAGPRLLVPWRAEYDPRALSRQAGFHLHLGPRVRADAVVEHLEPWRDEAERRAWIELEMTPADAMGHEQRARELALKMIQAWRVEPANVMLRKPWTRALEREPALTPDPLLGVFAQVGAQLAGRRYVGRLPAGDGVEALVFDGPAGGMLAVWNAGGDRQEAELHLHLGEQPVAADVWGNREALVESGGRHHLRFGATPTLVEGIDPELALLRASFAMEPGRLDSTLAPQQRTLVLSNPWDRTITGRLRVRGPADWRVSPAQHEFSIPAGQTHTFPVTIELPVLVSAGAEQLEVQLSFEADRSYDVTLSTPVDVGWEAVDVDASLALVPGRGDEPGVRDALVTLVIRNVSEQAVSLQAFASLHGHRRQERLVPRLQPGESTVHRFRIENAGEALQQYPIRTGVRQADGPATLNKVLRAP